MKRLPKFFVYKKSGAMQFSLFPAQDDGKNEFEIAKGFVMLEMAGSTGKTAPNGLANYDWKNGKVIMKLNEVDIQQILRGFQTGKTAIVHDPAKANGNSRSSMKKFLNFEKAPQSGYFVSMTFGEQKAKCSLSDEEARNLRILLTKAVTRIFGW